MHCLSRVLKHSKIYVDTDIPESSYNTVHIPFSKLNLQLFKKSITKKYNPHKLIPNFGLPLVGLTLF